MLCLLHLFNQILGKFALTPEEAKERMKLMEKNSVSEAIHTFKLFNL